MRIKQFYNIDTYIDESDIFFTLKETFCNMALFPLSNRNKFLIADSGMELISIKVSDPSV
jgi:hypothetical protein